MGKMLKITTKERKNVLLRDVDLYYIMFSLDENDDEKYIMEADIFFSKFTSPKLKNRDLYSVEIVTRDEAISVIESVIDSSATIQLITDEGEYTISKIADASKILSYLKS